MRRSTDNMIYENNYLNKELRQGYVENKMSTTNKVIFGLFIGLFSFALYFIFLLLKDSVLYDTVPEIMQASYFSTIYIYIHTALLINALYFIFYYESLFFYEIKNNSWYLLVKMSYNPIVMIFAKLIAMVFSVTTIYTVGFAFTVFLTFFLKYHLVLAYFPALYLTGLIDLVVISIISMMLSLFIRTVTNARYFIFFSVIALQILKHASGHYTVLSNRVSMQKLLNLLDLNKTLFLPIAGVIIVACGIICVTKARNISMYYNIPYNRYENILPRNLPVVLIDPVTARRKPLVDAERINRRRKALDFAITSFLILFIFAALAFNTMILILNASTFGSDFAIHGIIPYIFKSKTMEPAIMLNDLTYFKKIDETDQKIDIDTVILFEENNIVYVERVIEKGEDAFQVDIDNYPPMSEVGAMKKRVKPENIIGVYHGRSRWLGALILFANSIVGRVTFLLVPAVLLFYQKPIGEKVFQKTYK